MVSYFKNTYSDHVFHQMNQYIPSHPHHQVLDLCLNLLSNALLNHTNTA